MKEGDFMKFIKFALTVWTVFYFSHITLGDQLIDDLIGMFWNTMAWAFCFFMMYGAFRQVRAFLRAFYAGLNGTKTR
jgi:hypothetical protein